MLGPETHGCQSVLGDQTDSRYAHGPKRHPAKRG